MRLFSPKTQEDFEEDLKNIVLCSGCFCECKRQVEDHGIGPYEYGGATGTDEQLVLVSECCAYEVISFDDWDEAYSHLIERYAELEEKHFKLKRELDERKKTSR